ncbi:hypothetical protein AG1IA_02041 [Rhizoctonia solani AG-1 IA]|uniref:Uncharacterized protein n=1 Tax=Thanatephorus cucumeris (strain AG1-IA) TaxID=983506 RepID=L8X491_THACA|nr:hypothetical protein AG1IA_02041 [Rhizoctonia solani AG-1 IA]
MLDDPMTPRRPHPRSISLRACAPRTLHTMAEQSFGYYPHPSSFDSFSSLQYNQSPYDTGYIGHDNNPFADTNFVGTQPTPQDDAPSWSGSFSTPQTDGIAFQRRGAVSDAVPDQASPEASNDSVPKGLRIDTSCGSGNLDQHHVQELNHCHCYAMRRHTVASLVLVLLPDSGGRLHGPFAISNLSALLGLFAFVMTQPKHRANKHLRFYLSRPPRISARQ